MADAKGKTKYERFCDQVRFLQLSVMNQTFELLGEPDYEEPADTYYAFDQVETRYENNENGGFKVWHKSKFEIFHANPNEKDSREDYFKLFVSFKLQFSCSDKMDNEIFEAFKEKNVVTVCHPYFREIVATSMFRAGLPVITLPLIVE